MSKHGVSADTDTDLDRLPPKPNIILEANEEWFFCFDPNCHTWRIKQKGKSAICAPCQARANLANIQVIHGQVYSGSTANEEISARNDELYSSYEAGT